MRRASPLLICIALCAVGSPAAAQSSSPAPVAAADRIVITGRGSFHGLGMAMDGVEGQARAGWSHDRILSLFYPGTQTAHSHGTIRVWLAEGASQRVTLPSGGTVGAVRLPPGASATVFPTAGGRLKIRVDGLPKPAKKTASASRPTPKPSSRVPSRAGVVPPSPGLPSPSPSPGPTATPAPDRSPSTPGPDGSIAASPLMVAPSGQPALTTVTSVGRRYRGRIELRRVAGAVRVINHVTLDDYVSGIAEEKGAGWPLEGLKTLAVAARTLGVATMTWHDNHHAKGYDICPTDSCQVYHGYDGEEPAMREAAYATSGEIRTHNGRAILAMYHGNGGGHTASYKELSNDGAGNAYPYLRSVKYPHADPWRWKKETSLREIAGALRAAGVSNMPSPLKYVVVLKRGESPRVKRVGLFGDSRRGVAVTGLGFARALDLPSQWFYVHLPHRVPRAMDAAFLDLSDSSGGASSPPRAPEFPWPVAVLAGALAAFAACTNWSVNGGPASVTGILGSLRLRLLRRVPRRRPVRQPAADASPG